MTKFNSTQKFTAAAAFGAFAILGMLSFGSSAQAAMNLSSCQGNTAGKVVSCCEKLTEAQRPLWMIQSRTNCHEAAVCRGRQGRTIGIAALTVKRCYIQVVHKVKEGGGEKGDDKPSRGPNSLR